MAFIVDDQCVWANCVTALAFTRQVTQVKNLDVLAEFVLLASGQIESVDKVIPIRLNLGLEVVV